MFTTNAQRGADWLVGEGFSWERFIAAASDQEVASETSK